MTLATSIAGIGTVVQRWTIVLLVFVACVGIAFFGGCGYGVHRAHRAQQAEQLQTDRQQLQADQRELLRRAGINNAQTVKAAADQAADAAVYLKLNAEVPHVVLVSAPAGAGGDCRFSDDFVRLWNGALTATAADAAGRAATAPTAAGAAAGKPQP